MGLEDAKWIDADLLAKILRHADEDESIKVSELSVVPAKLAGDNFMSDMHRVTVRFSRVREGRESAEELSLLFKVATDTETLAEYIDELGVFETESSVMFNALPRMNEILKPLGTALSGRIFYAQMGKPKYIVVEDLTARGFRMADREEGLDLEHCLLAIRNLAKFHASSVALREKEPNIFNAHNKPMYDKDFPLIGRVVIIQMIRNLAKVTETWPELSPGTSEKIYKFADVFIDKLCECFLVYEEDFNVLIHGDCWQGNMLFRYDDAGKLLEQMFVDFQFSFYGSPGLDLLHSLSTSISEDVRENHRELLLREYHFALKSTMQKLECTTAAPSLDDLQEDMKRRFWYGRYASLIVWPAFVLNSVELKALNGPVVMGKEFFDVPGMHTRVFRKVASKILLDLESRGLLDA